MPTIISSRVWDVPHINGSGEADKKIIIIIIKKINSCLRERYTQYPFRVSHILSCLKETYLAHTVPKMCLAWSEATVSVARLNGFVRVMENLESHEI